MASFNVNPSICLKYSISLPYGRSRSSAQGYSVALPKLSPAVLGRGNRELSGAAVHLAEWDTGDTPVSAWGGLPLRRGLAVINCSCAFHFIEQCALPKLLAVLVGKWKSIRFISDKWHLQPSGDIPMAPARAFWKGYLKLSLVSCPIASTPGHQRPSECRSARSTRRQATACATSWSTK